MSQEKFHPAQSRQESLSIVCVPGLRCRDGPLGVLRLERCLFSRVNDSYENHTRPTCTVFSEQRQRRGTCLYISLSIAHPMALQCVVPLSQLPNKQLTLYMKIFSFQHQYFLSFLIIYYYFMIFSVLESLFYSLQKSS